MNGAGAPPIWQEARNSDGRVYYYNVQTKATQWAKPLELMTHVEVRISHHVLPYLSLLTLASPVESFVESTLQRVYCRRWPKVLVQHGD
jgi:hypothetical protein